MVMHMIWNTCTTATVFCIRSLPRLCLVQHVPADATLSFDIYIYIYGISTGTWVHAGLHSDADSL